MKFNYIKNDDGSITINDPIYGKICVAHPFSEIVLTKEMQRLSDISQNGFSHLEFEGLKNNDRLSHSIGAFHVMSLILKRLEQVLAHYNIQISKDDRDIALASILLHDIGHGPFSHSLEMITNYPHEKRTPEIILGNTEIGKLLKQVFGEKKIRRIVSFISETDKSDELEHDSFTKLFKNLVSHQLDADRIDYLTRDAYHAGIPHSINLEGLISNLSVVVNNNQEYELLILQNGLSCIEMLLIKRYQMYRDVYLSDISVLGDKIFECLINRIRSLPHSLENNPFASDLKKVLNDPEIRNQEYFLGISDSTFTKCFDYLAKYSDDAIIAYLSDFNDLDNYILIENGVPVSRIKDCLKDIFGNIDLNDTLSIMHIENKGKLYKPEQGLNIQAGNKIVDLTDCTSLIRSSANLEKKATFFNPTLLRLELGLSEEEFKQYEGEIQKMIDNLNKKPEEFELKYILDDTVNKAELQENILDLFTANGFKVISETKKENSDEYFDKANLELYHSGGSLRTRATQKKNGSIKYKGTYKRPSNEGEVYSSREEIETDLQNNTFESLKNEMMETGIPIDFNEILSKPILNSTTRRTDFILEKNGAQVCLSLDDSVYTNHYLNETMATDRMIEIEAIGELNDRIMLNDIHSFVSRGISGIRINKQSKYTRGVDKTFMLFKQNSLLNMQNDECLTSLSDAMKLRMLPKE